LRLITFLALIPLTLVATAAGKWRWVAGGALVSVGVAEAGRRRGKGTSVFPARAAAFAPLWLLERGVCSWLALGSRIFYGGVRYRRGIIKMAATPASRLEARFATGVPPSHPVP
jgi:hypothetical protein